MLAGDVIELGPQTGFYDQPYVEVEFFDQTTGLGPYGSEFGMGIYKFNRFLLDTGANSVLSAKGPTADMVARGYRTEGDYRELGVAGYMEFDISAPYRVEATGTAGSSITLPRGEDGTRIMSSTEVELGGPLYLGGVAGLIGMPAMVDRVTTLDLRPLAAISDLLATEPMGVSFSDALPDTPFPIDAGHRYTVVVDDRVSFDPEDGLPPDAPPNAPLPTWAPVPFLTAVGQYGERSASGNFLLDTGAQMTMISESLAMELGLDEDGDGDLLDEMLYSVPIGGVGGTREVPVMLIDQLRLPTEQGPELAWLGTDPGELGIEVLVLDIAPDIDGVLGVDLLTAGLGFDLDPTTFEITTYGAPYFDQIHLDFRRMMDDGTGTIHFDLHPYRADVSESGEATKVARGGLDDTYSIVLTAPPTSPVRINLASYEGRLRAVDEANPANDFLRFTPDDWNVPQTVRVTSTDTAGDGNDVDWIMHTSVSTDPHYDNLRISSVMTEIVDEILPAEVVARHIFYNGSAFDDHEVGVGPSDDGAIAPDKEALLPGATATLANYTSYSAGINGLVVDVKRLADPNAIGVDDFQFRVGNDNDPNGWSLAAIPRDIVVRQGAGVDGSDRITVVWDDGSIVNEWLQVTVRATPQTGLEEADTFYFGNAVGESGNDPATALVTVVDELAARNNRRGLANLASIDDPHDFNRDRLVNMADRLLARCHRTGLGESLRLISVPDTVEVGSLAKSGNIVESDVGEASPAKSELPVSIRSGSLTAVALLDWVEEIDDSPHSRRRLTEPRVSDTFWAYWDI